MLLRPVSVFLVVVLVAAAAAGTGYLVGVHAPRPGSGASTTAETLWLLAAGTLGPPLFPALAGVLANESPGLLVPSAAQQYTGSLSVVHAIAQEHALTDVAAVADFRLIPQVLEPSYASYEVVFASTSEVLVYDPGLAAFDGVNATNWGDDLLRATQGSGGVPLAVWNASVDPNGYNEIFALELQGALYGTGAAEYYSAFYSGALGAFAVPDPGTTLVEQESAAGTLVSSGVVCAAITYRSYAVAHHLPFVALDPIVGLESTSPGARAQYANLSTEILNAAGGTSIVHAAPVLFAATVPLDAINATLGSLFVHLLLSPQGDQLLAAGGGFDPVSPAWVDRPAEVPAVLAPDVVPMPSWAAAMLP